MTRPKLVSDDAILDAARHVMLQPRQEPFTLADVAHEVGLSRAAIIQRFKNKEQLQLLVAERGNRQLSEYLATLPKGNSARDAWNFLQNLIYAMGSSDRLPELLMMIKDDMVHPGLNRIARQRNQLVRDAIAERLPVDDPDARSEKASLLQAVLQGSSLQWGIDRQGEQKAFMARQVEHALRVMFPSTPL